MTRSYLELIQKVLKQPKSPNRTDIEARSLFGQSLRFDLRNGVLPVITTKPIPIKMIAKELFFFMRGETNQKLLEENGVGIWKGNSSRDYLDSRGLTEYKEYETLGPIYGFQWRHFGAKYIDCHTDYTGQGIDQLMNAINTIKTDPTNRRILISAWNPQDLDKMALPPCHVLIQFYVSHDGYLSGHLFQRSADLMLGVPFNITSYALLIHIMAKICGLKAGEFLHSMTDVHIYENHVDGAWEQLKRTPCDFPKVEIDIDLSLSPEEIVKNLHCDQIKIFNHVFDSRPIKLKMAV
ncbi:thymidylate synthase/pyrimidine hydroxymethylase-like protein [Tomelloso virus]|uniref:thymidylate synthase n=1 Tax=Tomelloso virus TaxID=2053981 RepID=A0A2H4T2V7_9VIRU|nr:thymidylate synthase/pyrimidine hydroxymethylase-like protein [Tomelloso virus]ATY70220.1 thymidylate synthase/pyrimidine hydroxymethylase-like protein [Tomelloso virus]